MAATALSPLHYCLQSLDAEFAGRDGWQVAERFPEAVPDAAFRGVAIADESANGKLQVQGEDAEGLVGAAFSAPPLAVGKSAIDRDPGAWPRLPPAPGPVFHRHRPRGGRCRPWTACAGNRGRRKTQKPR